MSELTKQLSEEEFFKDCFIKQQPWKMVSSPKTWIHTKEYNTKNVFYALAENDKKIKWKNLSVAEKVAFLKPLMEFNYKPALLSTLSEEFSINIGEEERKENEFQDYSDDEEIVQMDKQNQNISYKLNYPGFKEKEIIEQENLGKDSTKTCKCTFIMPEYKPNYDDIDLICLNFAKTLKKLSSDRQTIVKYKMAQLLMNEEMKMLME